MQCYYAYSIQAGKNAIHGNSAHFIFLNRFSEDKNLLFEFVDLVAISQLDIFTAIYYVQYW